MSDTKWRKLFSAIRERGIELARAEIKLVDADKPITIPFNDSWPWIADKAYLDTSDGGVAFREIEWLAFPAVVRIARHSNLPALEVRQDLDAIAATINAAGRYPLVRNDDALRVIAYRR